MQAQQWNCANFGDRESIKVLKTPKDCQSIVQGSLMIVTYRITMSESSGQPRAPLPIKKSALQTMDQGRSSGYRSRWFWFYLFQQWKYDNSCSALPACYFFLDWGIICTLIRTWVPVAWSVGRARLWFWTNDRFAQSAASIVDRKLSDDACCRWQGYFVAGMLSWYGTEAAHIAEDTGCWVGSVVLSF